ncbi:MAG: molybdopterin-dependent oxidoreductase, partial [Desulfobacterales bacterium]|nr:molybdopterin-dependent oxidoreductase [Desulfobacterales bacterium]
GKLEWQEKRGKKKNADSKSRGVGMASLLHVGGGARVYRSDGCGVIMKLDDFGNVSVMTGGIEMGQGF